MRLHLHTVIFSAVLAFGVSASAAHAVTIDPTSNLTDSVLTNRRVDGPRYNLSAAPFAWKASFVNSDTGGYAVFKFRNNTGKLQDVKVAMQALLNGVRGKFRRGVSAKWSGGISMRLQSGQFATISMKKQFAIGEIARLRIHFSNPVAAPGSSLGLKINVTSQDSPVFNAIAQNSSLPSQLIVSERSAGNTIAAPSSVPLPAPWLLMLTAIGGVLIVSRKRSETTA